MRTLIPIALLAIFIAPAGADEQVYKWMDAEGNIHYGPNPPAGIQAERIEAQEQPELTPAETTSQETTPQEASQEAPQEAPQEEKIYTWTDKEGKMHLSTQPPADNERTGRVEVRSESISATRSGEARSGEQEPDTGPRQQ